MPNKFLVHEMPFLLEALCYRNAFMALLEVKTSCYIRHIYLFNYNWIWNLTSDGLVWLVFCLCNECFLKYLIELLVHCRQSPTRESNLKPDDEPEFDETRVLLSWCKYSYFWNWIVCISYRMISLDTSLFKIVH